MRAVEAARTRLLAGLRSPALHDRGLRVWDGEANFLLVRHRGLDLRDELLRRGIAVRRGDTFPGLDRTFVRVAVHPDPSVGDRFLDALGDLLVVGRSGSTTSRG